MYQVIARKYRPSAFAELVSQEHVRTTLENAIKQQRIAHGYIFSGQRGTGKTTVARIMARCLNCINGPTIEPCGVCPSCREIAAGSSPDVIEIDAASNRGINEMRELRENVRYRPARDRYKVFIIDEAHQITTEAFNALLKTLEEPPEWVVFILCTTESHKIPITIASRCQQFSFRSVDFGELIARMRWICEQEGITADEESLAILAQAGEGSVRDSLSALDQAISCCGNVLSADELRSLLGRFGVESLATVTDALQASDPNQMLAIVQQLEANGQNLQHFCRELSRYLRNLLVAKISKKDTTLISASPAEQARLRDIAANFSEEDLTRYLQIVLDVFQDLQYSLQPRLHLELGLLKLVHAGKLVKLEEALANVSAPSERAASSASVALPPPRATAAATLPPRAAAPPRPAGPSPFERDSLRKTNPAPTPAAKPEPKAESATIGSSAGATAAVAVAPAPVTDLKEALHEALTELGMSYTADAVDHSDIAESAVEVQFTVSNRYKMAMSEGDLKKGLAKIGKPGLRVKIVVGEPTSAAAPAREAKKKDTDEELERRALEDPSVKRFQELFPDSHVRAIRNLKQD